MALSEEAILQQINVLTAKTSENPDMVYKTIAALNKALDPSYFSGHNSTIVNAINKLAGEVNLLNNAIVNLINKNNEVLSDIYTAENKENWADAKELMGVDNIIDGIRAILEGKKQDLILDLDIADNGKLLSVTINEVGQPEVKAVSIESLHVEVGAYDVAYLNRDFKELSSVGEALDKILEELGYKKRSIQENKRIRYILNDVEKLISRKVFKLFDSNSENLFSIFSSCIFLIFSHFNPPMYRT